MIKKIIARDNVQRRRPMPIWLKRPIACGGGKSDVETQCARHGLHTVCVEAKCPNRGECFGRKAATFLILGTVCSRNCAFCGVDHGAPGPVDCDEPEGICKAVKNMKLRHVVITSVTRDDLPDGGATHFARTVTMLKRNIPGISVEILVPDFNGNGLALEIILESGPDVFNHNIETVPRLYPVVRPQALYTRSLDILAKASRSVVQLTTKSGLMVGLGETREEVVGALHDLRQAGCSLVTIGQYLRPSESQVPVHAFITPEEFKRYESIGYNLGFSKVFAGPFVRSSYRADEMIHKKPETFF
ncbi:MAG: lipoyl synthase [Chitinivibrionales bacterium]